jgi:hypothetical protein
MRFTVHAQTADLCLRRNCLFASLLTPVLPPTLTMQAQTRQHSQATSSHAAPSALQQVHVAVSSCTAAPVHMQQRQVSCKAGKVPTVAFFGRSEPELTVVKLQVRTVPAAPFAVLHACSCPCPRPCLQLGWRAGKGRALYLQTVK